MESQRDIRSILREASSSIPDNLVISELKWRYLCRSVIRAKNTLILGPTGCGKTVTVKSVAKKFVSDEKFFFFNFGSTQDPRVSLIGTTNFEKSIGTTFDESMFISAIKTEGAIILLDEISRAHPDAWNILMSVLDDCQRYVRLDEKRGGEIVKVAPGVTFIATANIGSEYTSTRVMDRAFLDRFSVKIEMTPLSAEDEFKLLKTRFNITSEEDLTLLKSLVSIAEHTRKMINSSDSKLTNFISTRDTVEMAELITDGFSILDIAESVIYPNFDNDGGIDSERTYVRQLVQKHVPSNGSPDDLFNKKRQKVSIDPVTGKPVPF
jgi:MoxR-like ATPase